MGGKCTGAKNGKWRGGCSPNEKSYPRITSGPLRNVFVHHLVAEAMIGRPLTPTEEVHHIDRDPLNCHPSNLQVIEHQLHLDLHATEDTPF